MIHDMRRSTNFNLLLWTKRSVVFVDTFHLYDTDSGHLFLNIISFLKRTCQIQAIIHAARLHLSQSASPLLAV